MLMCLMGYDIKNILEDLHTKAYNSVMATFLIVKHETPGVIPLTVKPNSGSSVVWP